MKLLLTFLSAFWLAVFSLSGQTSNGIPLPHLQTEESAASPGIPGSPYVTSRQLTFYNQDSTINYQLWDDWDITTNSFVPESRNYFTYGPDGRLMELLSQRKRFGIWEDLLRITYTYYPDPAYLDGDAKINKRETWNSATGEWETIHLQTSVAYDAGSGPLEGSLKELTAEEFQGNLKVNGNITTYIREPVVNGLRTVSEARSVFIAATGLYQPQNKTEFIYNDLISTDYDTLLEYNWNELAMEWPAEPDFRTIQTIDGLVYDYLYQDMYNGDGIWVNNSRVKFVLDNYGQMVSVFSENWVDSIGDYVDNYRIEVSFNPDHSRDQILGYFLDYSNLGSGLHLTYRTTFGYDPVVLATSAPVRLPATAFPNPASESLKITFENRTGNPTSLLLTDLTGRVLSRIQTSENQADISLSGLAQGAYIVRLQQGAAVKMIPVIKQ